MKLFLLILISLLICGCESKYAYHPSEKEKLANTVIKKTAIQIEHEFGLIPCGTGGQMMDQIKMLGLSFDYYKPIEIEEGRKLLISAVQKCMVLVNADENIRPYLSNYPFEAKNIEIRIFIQKPDFSDFGPEKLCVISSIQGVLQYKIHDEHTQQLRTLYKETYEEALKKLNR